MAKDIYHIKTYLKKANISSLYNKLGLQNRIIRDEDTRTLN